MSYPARLKRDTLSSQSRREFFIPQPSLHIGLLRSDPWNEFLVHQPVSAEDLLNFQSIKAREDQELHEQVDKQLTVIAGRGPPSPPPVSVNDLLFGGPQLFQTAPEAVNPVVVGGDSINGAAEVAASEEPSLWNRMSSAWENLKTTTNTSLPDWFANEQSLVIPKDPEVRKVLGSIYGGTRTRVVVTVRVIEAVGVPALDWWGTSDPYVTVCLVRGVGGLSAGRLDLLPTMGGLKSTAPKFGTLDPKWNESVQLEPADLLSVISDSVLHISMWDKDVMVTDDPVGYTTVSLIDALQVGGVSPFPILPIQVTGSLIGPHAGVFVKIQLRMVNKVGCLSITPVALQGFTRGWEGYSIRLEVKITKSDPIASQFYVSEGLSQPESTPSAKVNDTGHAVWPSNTNPVTVLFSAPKHSKPYLHITLKSDGAVAVDPGQIAIRIGMLERLQGIVGMKLSALEGSPDSELLNKCSLYCGVECDLLD